MKRILLTATLVVLSLVGATSYSTEVTGYQQTENVSQTIKDVTAAMNKEFILDRVKYDSFDDGKNMIAIYPNMFRLTLNPWNFASTKGDVQIERSVVNGKSVYRFFFDDFYWVMKYTKKNSNSYQYDGEMFESANGPSLKVTVFCDYSLKDLVDPSAKERLSKIESDKGGIFFYIKDGPFFILFPVQPVNYSFQNGKFTNLNE